MLEPRHALAAFRALELAGVKPTETIAADMTGATRAYAAALADLTPEDLTAATLAYIRAPLPAGKWFKEWPDVGALLVHAPARRALAAAPDDAVATYHLVRPLRMALGPDKPPARFVKDATPAGDRRERAVWAGIQALGGWGPMGEREVKSQGYDERDFAAAYRAVMRAPTETLPALAAGPAAAALPARDLAQLTGGIGTGGRR